MARAMSLRNIEELVQESLLQVLRDDAYLLEIGASERSVTHKLAEYLQQRFPLHHVDCEYNRNRLSTKLLPRKCQELEGIVDREYVYPDIIIHHRGTQLRNLLVIETKLSSSPNVVGCDEVKLSEFTKRNGLYKYSYGLYIAFDNLETPKLTWYQNGEQI